MVGTVPFPFVSSFTVSRIIPLPQETPDVLVPPSKLMAIELLEPFSRIPGKTREEDRFQRASLSLLESRISDVFYYNNAVITCENNLSCV